MTEISTLARLMNNMRAEGTLLTNDEIKNMIIGYDNSDFWGITSHDIITMDFDDIENTMLWASHLPANKLVALITAKRIDATSDAIILACSRILCALIGGPDVLLD